ncbi:hypothetical protein A2230_08245 [candidate division WOR-1 bacterium RIFOXYA2_FULL_36_21]|uniref:Glycosyl transferase family 1 domain-containing protein n=1 Tax=candidate division WOR-1 bacterium RIFOXYB2_FULL_36_35 TaxID=1802578 RepID=A0A1F4S894_UNCSA|nr:MAG: hypothetical protein A2230_08245 [candidate division WOR-1 bacterium RIFOXYA2_FULL_36_21]OGC14631.1 MAG: hypothetical protein A2282_04260 [candidate division WOR-1 bacterium RIFOXYA12_FULL_36_13]OGC16646.1 MAG: hypothetical protein A2290_03460 [candidate division WOR-1 bacterium RIFOXYB2_FULL_36_35]
MRILYISSDLIVHDYRFLKKLCEFDHDVYLVTHFAGKDLPQDISGLRGLKIIRYNPNAVLLGTEKYSIFTRKIRCWLAFMQSYIKFKRELKKIKPDIVHAGWVQGDGFLAAVSDFHPFLLMPWGSDILVFPEKSKRTMSKTKYVLSKADMITCDCEIVKKKIIEFSNYDSEKIIVFPWGIDLDLFKPNKKNNLIRKALGWEDKKILLMTRSFFPIYAVDDFIKAIPKIIKAYPNTRIILVGDGPLRSELEQLTVNLGIRDYVYFAESIPNDKMPEYFNSADIYLSCSLSDGTSLSLLEAMACSLPVVTTDIPSYLEWINDGENGYIVPTRSPNDISAKVINLLSNHNLRIKMGHRNFLIAQERANWDINYRKLELIYGKLQKNK